MEVGLESNSIICLVSLPPRDSEKLGESVPCLGPWSPGVRDWEYPAPGQPCTLPDLGILEFGHTWLSLALAHSEVGDSSGP